MPIRISSDHYFGVQVVGNEASLKRMVVSIYLEDAKQNEQTIKVCICDDLPHVIKQCEKMFRSGTNKGNELLQSGMLLSIAHGKSLTVFANTAHTSEKNCWITPFEEVVLRPKDVWESEAVLTVDYKVTLKKPNESASIQISIYSQDEGGNEIPLCVPPRLSLQWIPKNIQGVTTLRRVLEKDKAENSQKRNSWNVSKQPYMQQYFLQARGYAGKSQTLPRHQQPAFSSVNAVVEQKAKVVHERTASTDRTSQSSSYNSDTASNSWEASDKSYSPRFFANSNKYNSLPMTTNNHHNWNVIKEPRKPELISQQTEDLRLSSQYTSHGEPLPQWAKGLGDQFNYDDVVVV